MANRAITETLAQKVFATLEQAEHLVSLVLAEELTWRPRASGGMEVGSDLGHLLGHILDCMAGFCAAFNAAFPEELAHLADLKAAKVNHFCEPDEWRKRAKIYGVEISNGFRLCTDKDLTRRLETVFVSQGEVFATILLGNLEHLLNHKYQLFSYLKLLGKPVGTADLYSLPELTCEKNRVNKNSRMT
jgi:uncharacterized damage-inducible protein DinB